MGALPDWVVARIRDELDPGDDPLVVSDVHLAAGHLIRQWFAHPENITGGCFHIVVEDGNTTDRSIEFCVEQLAEAELPPAVAMTGALMGFVLGHLSEAERELVVALGWPGGVSERPGSMPDCLGLVIHPIPVGDDHGG